MTKMEVFSNEIKGYEQQLLTIIKDMDKTKNELIKAAVECLQKWYQQRARYYVQEQYVWSSKLGVEKMAQMKKMVLDLVNSVPQSAAQLLANDQLWWHKTRGGGWKDSYAEGAPEPLREAVNLLASKLTPILKKFGYIRDDAGQVALHDGDEEDMPSPMAREYDPESVEWPEDMLSLVKAYREQLGRALFLDSKMAEARKLRQKYEAGALWDKI